MTNVDENDILDKLFRTTEMIEKEQQNKIKKLLTIDAECDNINELSMRQQRKRTLIIK